VGLGWRSTSRQTWTARFRVGSSGHACAGS
jgi:hypothetical protein